MWEGTAGRLYRLTDITSCLQIDVVFCLSDVPAHGHGVRANMPHSRLDHFILTVIIISTIAVVVPTATADIIVRMGLDEPYRRKTGGWLEAQ